MNKIIESTIKTLQELNSWDQIDGMLSVGGSIGTVLSLNLMDALTLGLP